MGVDGGARCINVTSGAEIWRARHVFHSVPWYIGWTDGGPALGPNGKFYTVSSFSPHIAAHRSNGGGLHAFDVHEGRLSWEVSDLHEGIYTYPAVGYANGQLTVITGVGSLASVPCLYVVAKAAPFALSRGAFLGLLLWTLQFGWRRCYGWFRRRPTSYFSWWPLLLWPLLSGVLCATAFCTVIASWALKNSYDYSIQALVSDAKDTLHHFVSAHLLVPWGKFSKSAVLEGRKPQTRRVVQGPFTFCVRHCPM
eukprot:6423820-Amphidinium_carterae.1